MSRRRTHNRDFCVFCGKRELLTRDHIPPKCLFGQQGNLPSKLITVPACKSCNLSTSGDDEYLRLVLASEVEASSHETALSLHPKIIRSASRQNAAVSIKDFFQNAVDRRVFTPSGIYLGTMPTTKIDYSKLRSIMQKIVKGLFFEEYKKRLPVSYDIKVIYTNRMQQNGQSVGLEEWRNGIAELVDGSPKRVVGNRAFVYKFQQHPEDEFSSVWAMAFYECHEFVAFTHPA